MFRWKLKWPSKNQLRDLTGRVEGTQQPVDPVADHIAPAPTPVLKNMFLVNSGLSGASAIVPIISEIVSARGVGIKYHLNQTAELTADPQPQPFFHWTHDCYDHLRSHFSPLNIVCLLRDPRDIAVSAVMAVLHLWVREKGHLPPGHEYIGPVPPLESMPDNPEEAITREIELKALKYFIDTPTCSGGVERQCEWLRLARESSFKVVRFDEVKKDTVKVVLEILEFYGLQVTPDMAAEVQALYDEKYSFEAMVGRPRGTAGGTHSKGFWVRKGISGEWRQKFDDELVELYDRKYGKDIEFLGYEPCVPRGGLSVPVSESHTRGLQS